MSADRITVRGLRAHGYHGVLTDERQTGQVFVVDAVLELDTGAAAERDELSRTVDYAALAQRLAAVVAGPPVDLIETLAARLAAVCLDDERVTATEITVHKPHAPVDVPVEDVAVTIRRERR